MTDHNIVQIFRISNSLYFKEYNKCLIAQTGNKTF